MNITPQHLTYYVHRKVKYPRWAGTLGTPAQVSVHTLINLQLSTSTYAGLDVANALHVLRLRRRRMSDREAVTFSDTAQISSRRRTTYARILRKMNHARRGA